MPGPHHADGYRPPASVHAHLHVPGHTRVHRLDPAAKIAGLLGFVVAVAITPREAWPVFLAEAAIVAGVVATARLAPGIVLARLAPVLPFMLLAALMPVVGRGARIDVDLGPATIGLSRDGLWAGFGVAAKALLGASASVVLAATTPIDDIIAGLSRLRVPAALIAIVAFMVRYLDLLADELRRMRTSMVARCHDPRWLWQARPIAASVGTLFVRSYERGERVHRAMLARGFTGTLPDLATPAPAGPPVVTAFVPGLLAGTAVLAWSLLGWLA